MEEKDIVRDLKTHINRLKFERVGGTEGERKARGYILRVIESYGYSPEVKEFKIKAFKPGRCMIQFGDDHVEGKVFGGFENFEIEGELIYTDHYSMLKDDARDRIVLTPSRIPHKDYQKLSKKGVKGVIVVGPPGRNVPSAHMPQKLIGSLTFPQIVVSHEDGLKLFKRRNRNVRIKGRGSVMESTSANIVLNRGKHQRIVLTAHYDTVPGSKGMSDNGGGTVVLLSLVKHLDNVRFVWFGSEELGLLGSFHYTSTEDLKDVELVVNVDVTGDDIGINRLIITGNNKLHRRVKSILKGMNVYATTGINIYSSDSLPFADRGIPSVNISRTGGIPSFHVHTKEDVWSIEGYGLYQSFLITKRLVEELQKDDLKVYEITSKIRKKVEMYKKRTLYSSG